MSVVTCESAGTEASVAGHQGAVVLHGALVLLPLDARGEVRDGLAGEGTAYHEVWVGGAGHTSVKSATVSMNTSAKHTLR